MYFLVNGYFRSFKLIIVEWLKVMFWEEWFCNFLVVFLGLVMWRSFMKIEGKIVSEVSRLDCDC